MRHLLDILDLSVEEIDELLATANDIIEHPEKYREACKYKKLATLFFEPSTRTRLSFEAAMMELGGNVLGFSEASSSSASKGESIADTAAIVSGYADIIAMRHPKEGAPMMATTTSGVPIINAGDGGHHHPTQTLTDMLTIKREKGRLDNMKIGLCGDLKFGRTVHSLIAALSRCTGIEFILISPDELQVPSYVKYPHLIDKGVAYRQATSLDEVIGELDVLYMTRIQRERFLLEDEYLRLKDSYVLTPEKMAMAKKDLIVMHPLPRVNEISTAIDADPRAAYFRQAKYGKYVRMALILKLLGQADGEKHNLLDHIQQPVTEEFICHNPRCITSTEQDIKHIFKLTDKENSIYRCVYCDTRAEIKR